MFSSGQSRKASAPPKDLFSAFSPASKVVVRSVIKPRQPAQSLNAPRTSSPLSRPPNKPPPSAPLPSLETSPTKRKRASLREASEFAGVKRLRRSKDLVRVASPAPSRSARSSLSRSLGQGFGTLEKPVPRPKVITKEDGNVPHVTSEEVVVRFLREAATGKKGKKGYRAFFKNPADPQDKSFEPGPQPPVVELDYPNIGASERFVLLYPTDRDDYQPVRELVRTITTIVECYLTPAQRSPLGTLSGPSNLSVPTSVWASPSPSRPISPVPGTGASTPTPETSASEPLLRTLEKAYHTKNGPLFVRTVEAISAYFRNIKNDMVANAHDFFDASSSSSEDTGLKENAREHGSEPSRTETPFPVTGGVPVKLWKTIMEEVYQRSVGLDVDETRKYKSFSSETYGELNPIFVSDIIHRLGLTPGKVFLDLGSGVGNCVLQAALQAGCDSYGIELNPPVAALSFVQQREFAARLRMWGVTSGSVTLREGDFVESAEVSEWIRKADVVLVNNYIFSSDLNESLTWRFLDLQEGAKVVVLKPFWPLNRPLTERTAYTPEAVLANGVERVEYITDSVSWTKEPGEFFIYTKTDGHASVTSERPNRTS